MTETLPETGDDLFVGQPVRVVERDGVRYTLLGTAHVSRASVEAVEKAIDSGRFDAVAVELDPQRLQALSDPDTLAKLDLVEVIRKGRVALFAGALPYTQYGLVKRHMMRKIVGDKPGHLGTDISRDYVYTEWDGVKRFAEHFTADLEATF